MGYWLMNKFAKKTVLSEIRFVEAVNCYARFEYE